MALRSQARVGLAHTGGDRSGREVGRSRVVLRGLGLGSVEWDPNQMGASYRSEAKCGARRIFEHPLTQRHHEKHAKNEQSRLARHVLFLPLCGNGSGRRHIPHSWNTKVGSPAFSGRAVVLPLTRTPMTGCSCRAGGPTFSFQPPWLPLGWLPSGLWRSPRRQRQKPVKQASLDDQGGRALVLRGYSVPRAVPVESVDRASVASIGRAPHS